VNKIVKDIKKEIKPTDCKKKSEITLPLKPNILFILLPLENTKFGSCGEYVTNDAKKNNPKITIVNPINSIILLKTKLAMFVPILFNSINILRI